MYFLQHDIIIIVQGHEFNVNAYLQSDLGSLLYSDCVPFNLLANNYQPHILLEVKSEKTIK